MDLATATWAEMDDVETDLAVLPVGSTEQHGPHAPLSTDTLNATTVASTAADRYEAPVVVAPPVPVGVAEEHRAFAGTLWVEESTFRSYVREVVASLAHHGWERVVLVNGHGGNTAALREVAARITRHDDAYAVAFTWFEAAGDTDVPMGHGGARETSLLWHAHPETVREDRLEAAAAGAADGWGEWQSGVNLAYDTDEFTANGVVGDPREASADRGEALLEATTGALGALLEAVADRDLD